MKQTMPSNKSLNHTKGYTLIELLIVIMLITLIASILTPKFDLVLQGAYQSKAKGDLSIIRSALNIYYSQNENWPLKGYPEGDSHYTVDGLSLTSMLVPQCISNIPTPKVHEGMYTYNDLATSFDSDAASFMAMTPPKDVFIVWGEADYTPLLQSPFAYDNQTGKIYYPNGNYDMKNEFIYSW